MSMQILLSSTQAGPGRKVKQEQEEISRNHVPRLFLGSVQINLQLLTKLEEVYLFIEHYMSIYQMRRHLCLLAM